MDTQKTCLPGRWRRLNVDTASTCDTEEGCTGKSWAGGLDFACFLSSSSRALITASV